MKLCRLLHLLAALSLLLACLHTSGARAQGAAEQPQQDAAAPDYANELLTDVPLDLAAGADADTDADADEAAVDADTPLLPTSNAAMDLPEPGTLRHVASCRAAERARLPRWYARLPCVCATSHCHSRAPSSGSPVARLVQTHRNATHHLVRDARWQAGRQQGELRHGPEHQPAAVL